VPFVFLAAMVKVAVPVNGGIVNRSFSMRRLATLLAATVLVGCQGFNLPITGAGARYGQLNFTPASQTSLNLVQQQGGQKATAPTAPTAANGAAGADMAVGAPSMAMPAPMPYYYGGSYWGNEYELVSTSEAKTGGFQGTYQQTMDSVVKPLVADWATDAVLRSAGGMTDATGVNLKASPMPSVAPDTVATAFPGGDPAMPQTKPMVMPVYQQPTGWRFEYGSRAKRETLYFYVTADSTLVVKQAYRERVQDLSGAKLNSAEVIAIVTKAIQDKSIQANDPYQQVVSGGSVGIAVPGVAVAPMPAVAPTASGNTSMPVGAPPPETRPSMPAEEELTTIPPNARWDLSLNLESLPTQTKPDGTNPAPMPTRLVWNISMQMDYINQTPGIGYSGAWARVDATTGALLSLNRPRKYTYATGTDSGPTPPTPMPMPAVSAGSSGSGTASAGTATSAGPAPTVATK
jgi:hypothetical protein